MTPNSAELKSLYHRSDVFCLPTRGDCLPMVLSEAGAAGLPLVSTRVGAIPEIVVDGRTGFVVPQDDARALARVLEDLVTNAELRHRLGAEAAQLVGRRFDAASNARRLVEVLVAAASQGPRPLRSGPTRSIARAADRSGTRDLLLTVSGVVPSDVRAQVCDGKRPRPDYLVIADTLGADLLDYEEARAGGGPLGSAIARVAGRNAALAWAAFRLRRRYDVILTDGEQIGLPYAVLTRLTRGRRTGHVMIAHVMSVAKKSVPFRLLGLGSAVDTMVVYATAQQRYLGERLGVPPGKVVRSPFMVDTTFFAPEAATPSTSRPLICSAGLEFRDYPTMVEAVRGLDVDVVLAAASPWSKRADTTQGTVLPDNVEVCRLGFVDLRQLYADSRFVVMPLEDVPFQAGVTTILEAMAMGRAVICSRTAGQTDVVVDGETGLYVPPGDAAALRAAIAALLDDPERARRMGAAGRRRVLEEMDVERYARGLGRIVDRAASGADRRSSRVGRRS